MANTIRENLNLAAADVAANEQAKPWPRFWARLLDIFVAGSVLSAVVWILFPNLAANPVFDGRDGAQFFGLMLLPVALIFDAIILRIFGNTLGKAIAGIRIETSDHERIYLTTAIHRNLIIYVKGLALGIPIICLFTYLRSQDRLQKGQQTSWDEKLGTRVLNVSNNTTRTTITALIFLSIFSLEIWLEIRGEGDPTSRPSTTEAPVYAPPEPAPDPIAGELAESARTVRPAMVDQITKLESASAHGRTLTFHYRILRRDVSDTNFIQYFWREMAPDVCSDAETRANMRDYGITYRYSYLMPNADDPINLNVNWSRCENLGRN